jgi:hypothetical protein
MKGMILIAAAIGVALFACPMHGSLFAQPESGEGRPVEADKITAEKDAGSGASQEKKEDAADEDESGDEGGSGSGGSAEQAAESSGGAVFSLEGMAVFSHLVNTYREQEPADANKKAEVRNRLKLKYGTDALHVYAVPNAYFMTTFISEEIGKDYVYSDKTEVGRNLRISTKASELSFNELYLHYSSEKFRLRLGNQIFAWGTADAFNPTSYFNPLDAREFIFRDDDELNQGVPAVSGMFYIKDYVLELVYVPVHVPMALPDNDNFWFLRMTGMPLRAVVDERGGMEMNGRNMAYGARFSGSAKGVDMSISGYHGPDKEPVLVPSSVKFPPNETVAIEARPEYYIVNKMGLDASTSFDKFVVQCEMAYSPDKRGLEELPDDITGVSLPLPVKKSHYFSYSTGFNYFIPLNRIFEGHEGDSVLTFEWTQSMFFDRELDEPMLSKLISTRIEDTYLDSRLKIKLTLIYETREWGYIFWPRVEWDFQNGLSLELAYANISGGEDSFMYYYRDNDIFMWKIRYTY